MNKWKALPCFFLLTSALWLTASVTVHAQLTGELGAHDPSTVIFDDGRYYYFATGELLATRSSADLTNWTNEGAAFDAVPSWVPGAVPGYQGQSLWAPDVIKLENQYYLYYSASIFGTKLSGIGYASSPTLDPDAPGYGWTDHGIILNSTHSSPYNAIDPSLMLDEDTGRLWMTWGSFNNGIYVKEMNPATGAPLNSTVGVNVAAPSPTPEIEGAAMVNRDGFYYMFVNWGGCCSGVDSTYNMRVGRSTSPTGPFLDRDGVNMLNDGGTLFLDDDGAKIGPGHFSFTNVNGQDKFSYHYYNGDVVGAPTFGLRDLHWTSDNWPSIAAVNPNWTGPARGDWSLATNWTNDTVPDGIGHVANFAAQTSGSYGIALTNARTVGTINFRGAATYLVGSSAGPTLTLDDIAGETATLNVAAGSHTIGAPITAVDHLGANVTPASSTLTLGGRVVGTGLTKYGDGTLTLAGSNSSLSGGVFVKYGTVDITGSVTANSFSSVGQILTETGTLRVRGSGSFTSNGDLNIGDSGDSFTPATGTLEISDQASVLVGTGGGFYVGSGFFANSKAVGTVVQSGGTLTVNRPADGSFVIGGRGSDEAIGVYNLSGGNVAANTNVFVGGLGEGSVDQTGGTFNASQFLAIGRYAGSTGDWRISGGTLNQTNAATWLLVGEQGQGTLTIDNIGEVNAHGTLRVGFQASGGGTINLDGGVLSTSLITRGAGSATVNFNGGILRARNNSGSFLQGLTAANVKSGGAVFDTQAFSVTIAQALAHDSSLGTTSDGGLTKRGVGTLALTSENTYTGVTTIDEGTLLANSQTGSSTGLGPVVVNSSGVLGGVGSVQGAVFVDSGGVIAPGVSTGKLTLSSAVFNGGATLAVEVAGDGGVAGIDFDQLVVTGDVSIDGMLEVSLISSFIPSFGDSFEIINVGGLLTGTFSGLPQAAKVSNFGGTDLFIDYEGGDGNDVTLVATLAGDFDLDFDVDGHDFLKWQQNPSIGSLADWQTNYDLQSLPLSTQRIPEPAGLMLVFVAVTLSVLCPIRR